MAGADGHRETEWLLQESARSAHVRRLVIWAPVERPDLPGFLDAALAAGGGRIAGVRRAIEGQPPDFCRSPSVLAGVRSLAGRGLSFDLVLTPDQMGAATALVAACPEVRFILDHAGKPAVGGAFSQAWSAALREMARLPNVACKISGLITEADLERWTREDIEPYVRHAIECFGWDRVLFGSDWPVCLLAGGVERWLEAVMWCLRDATAEQIECLLCRNTARSYCLSLFT